MTTILNSPKRNLDNSNVLYDLDFDIDEPDRPYI